MYSFKSLTHHNRVQSALLIIPAMP